MGFYYGSLFSIVPLAIAYGILALVFWGVVRATRGMRGRGLALGIAGIVVVLLPIGEELWIAWNFGQACKQAGTFISKKVEVDGFYNDTGVSLELVRSGLYRFVEGPSRERGVVRVTLGDREFMEEALRRFQRENPSKDLATQDNVRVRLDDRTEALVYPKRGDSWRLIYLDRPTARYHFRNTDPMNGTPWGHKVGRSGSVVIDTETSKEIARYTSFGREPPWFYVSLAVAPYACDAPGRWPNPRGNPLVYREVLIPATKQ